MKKTLIAKLAGGVFAVGIVATALIGQPGRASADGPYIFLKPDLEVTNLTVQQMPGQNKLYVHFLLKNNGVFQVNQPKYSITVNGQLVDVVQTGVLQGGATIGETLMNVEIPGGGNKIVESGRPYTSSTVQRAEQHADGGIIFWPAVRTTGDERQAVQRPPGFPRDRVHTERTDAHHSQRAVPGPPASSLG
jgi:hypothetical protein